jgi:enoyl-CoA hydratase/carnithine racemase
MSQYEIINLELVISGMEELGKPVIAAVNGYALGAGSEIAQACHLVIASENAYFGQPEINLGFNPLVLMLLFSLKGEVIIGNPLTIVWIAVPILSVT